MGIIGGELGYRLLKALAPRGDGLSSMDGSAYSDRSKLRALLGDELLSQVRGVRVVDFGCGPGAEVIELAQAGAAHVTGIDIQESFLEQGRATAARLGLSDRVSFASVAQGETDVIVSIDSFEHFDDPAGILTTMFGILRPGGRVLTSFGPTWYHPLGGHLFSVFPWSHLVFTERALLRWRADFKTDGATRFGEVAGGLNQMTIRRFVRLVEASPFKLVALEPVPIRKLRRVSNRFTREFTTAIVRAILEKPLP